ncbi:MAG TPA: endonuclease/exonuclease/phosphatase family protein [Alphaproteobacteria bacterium]|nr:endonuclease/exonuclease/phosphatase family protein [Alphaproteobacteria bacterium]
MTAMPKLVESPEPRVAARPLRLLTYNIHSCIGTDRRVSVERVAEVIAACVPDVVALQEVDVGRARTGGADQAAEIARLLGMESHFHAALRRGDEAYGVALLTALPARRVKAGPLPGLAGRPGLEPRGALWLAVEAGGAELQVITTHFGLHPAEQRAQAAALAGPDWLGHPDCGGPAVLLGDFNAFPGSRPYRRLAAQIADAQRAPAGRAGATFPSRLPLLRIDHVFARGADVAAGAVMRSPLARLASDHLPLAVDLALAAAPAAARTAERRAA